jgi:hypothetical protein
MQPADIKRCSPLSQRPGIDPAQHRLTMLLGLLPLLIAVLQWTLALPGVSRLVAGLGVLGLLWLIAVMDEAKAWLGAAIVVPSLCAALGSLLGNQLPVIVAAPALIATATATGVWIDGISRFSNKIDGRMAGDPIELVACVGGMTLVIALIGLLGLTLLIGMTAESGIRCTGARSVRRRLRRFNIGYVLVGALVLWLGL